LKVWDYLSERLERGENLHMSLIDPENFTPKKAAERAIIAEKAGTSAIMIGGSTGEGISIDDIVKEIKCSVGLPIILFPSGAGMLSKYADAVFFMSLLNSKSSRFLIEEQLKGIPLITENRIEPISMGYLVVGEGRKVGKVGMINPINVNDSSIAVNYGLLAQYFGMQIFYLEAGSGAREPLPPQLVRAVKGRISIPLIVGGGIKTPEQARKLALAGASIIVTGQLIEKSRNLKKNISEIVQAINQGTKSYQK
jgi:phosphoglycerol geranylgeranyltransferase